MAERGTDAPTGVAVAVRIALVLTLLVLIPASVRFAASTGRGCPSTGNRRRSCGR